MYNIKNQIILIILVMYFVLYIREEIINNIFFIKKCKVLKHRYIFLSISSLDFFDLKKLIKGKNQVDYSSSFFFFLLI